MKACLKGLLQGRFYDRLSQVLEIGFGGAPRSLNTRNPKSSRFVGLMGSSRRKFEKKACIEILQHCTSYTRYSFCRKRFRQGPTESRTQFGCRLRPATVAVPSRTYPPSFLNVFRRKILNPEAGLAIRPVPSLARSLVNRQRPKRGSGARCSAALMLWHLELLSGGLLGFGASGHQGFFCQL